MTINNNNLSRVQYWVAKDLAGCKAMHQRLARRLSSLSKTGLSDKLLFTTKKGRKYYSEAWLEDGNRRTRYLGTADNEDVQLIQEKRFLEKSLVALKKRIRDLEKGMQILEPLDMYALNASLPAAYRMSDDSIARIVGPDESARWFAEALREKEYIDARSPQKFIGRLTKTAKDGTKMRSKSEVIIANELINRGIPYIYEMPVTVGNITLHPDFIFYSYSRSKPMMWEHAGMLGDDLYRKDFADRMSLYMRCGIVPCTDMILTFDTADGDIDARLINDVIDEYL